RYHGAPFGTVMSPIPNCTIPLTYVIWIVAGSVTVRAGTKGTSVATGFPKSPEAFPGTKTVTCASATVETATNSVNRARTDAVALANDLIESGKFILVFFMLSSSDVLVPRLKSTIQSFARVHPVHG